MPIWFSHPDQPQLFAMAANTMIDHLGIEFTELGDDFLSARMPVDRRTVQPARLLHGGASVALAETLGSAASYLCVDPAQHNVVGIEVNANHVRAVRSGWVTGVARPIHLGKSTHVWDIRIVDDQDRLVCVARLTMAVVARA
jgi:1,4-dihydroxy-2-naphthoyl-CoA hydrolase